MSKPLSAGQDGVDAQHALSPLFSDPTLQSELTKFAGIQGPDADCRQVVLSWMKQNGMSIVAGKIEQLLAQQTPAQPEPTQAPAAPAPQPTGAPTTDQQVQPPVAESKDPLDFMRRLAGLVK